LTNINPNEDVLYIEEDNPYPTRFYTEEEEAQNIKDEQLMARVDIEGLAYERSYRYEDYDNLEGMLADGIDIDDIPESLYTRQLNKKNSNKKEEKYDPWVVINKDAIKIPF
jgi:hypothetical protein